MAPLASHGVAFVAQSVVDLVQTVLYERAAHGLAVRPLLGVLGIVYSFDALLTPVALLAARTAAMRSSPSAVHGCADLLGIERRSRLDAQSEADRLDALAHLDDLTRAPNRRSFDQRLVSEQARAGRSGSGVSVCFLDLDGFKRYNDRLGHPAGDDLLRRVTAAWAGTLRQEALLARIGGDEFGLILPDASPETAEVVVERLRRVTPREITFSAGIAGWRDARRSTS